MEMHELLKMNEKDLRAKLAELQELNRKYQFEVANMQLKNVRAIRNVKKDIARIQTALTQIAAQQPADKK